VPSQFPAQIPVPVHAARPPCVAPVTLEQVPTLPATSQAWHWPVHAALQHTPSTQWPFAHSPFVVQVAPSDLPATHALPTQA
jgi:hypothetical protein